MNVELKVKIKSLAAEAKIIRGEEGKQRKHIAKARSVGNETWLAQHRAKRDGLRAHRKDVVRYEARHSLLAYGFLRGVPYRAMELKCHEPPDWSKVLKIAERFGGGSRDNEFKAWREAA